jgi:hypothetical protein
MSSSSAGPDPGPAPGPRPGGAPQGRPAWGPPPPQGQPPASGYGQQIPGYGPAPSYQGRPGPMSDRPGGVMAAAIIGIVMGGLALLSLFSVGLLFTFGGFLGVLALLSVAAGIVLLVGGIQVLQGKSPQLLILGSYASIAVQLLTLVWALVSGWGFLFTGFLGFLLPAAIVYLLRQPVAKQYYAARGIQY